MSYYGRHGLQWSGDVSSAIAFSFSYSDDTRAAFEARSIFWDKFREPMAYLA